MKMRAHFFGFEILKGTGMGFLLSNPNFGQYIEYCLAFNFQFSGEIVNSNFAHPCFWCLHLPR
jgi:hypothetical protein